MTERKATPSYMNGSRNGPPDGRVEDDRYVHDVIGPNDEKLKCTTCGSPQCQTQYLFIKPFYGHRNGHRVERLWLDPGGTVADKGQLATVIWVSKDRSHIKVVLASDTDRAHPIIVASGKFKPSGNFMLTADVNEGLAQQYKKESAAASNFNSVGISEGAYAQWAKLSSTSPDNPLACGTNPLDALRERQQRQESKHIERMQRQHQGSAAFRSPGRDSPVVGVMAPGDGGSLLNPNERMVWVRMVVNKSELAQTPGGSMYYRPSGPAPEVRVSSSMPVRPATARESARMIGGSDPLSSSSRRAAAAAAAANAAPSPHISQRASVTTQPAALPRIIPRPLTAQQVKPVRASMVTKAK